MGHIVEALFITRSVFPAKTGIHVAPRSDAQISISPRFCGGGALRKENKGMIAKERGGWMLKKTVVLGSLLSLLFGNPALAQVPCFKSGFLMGSDPHGQGKSKASFKNGTPEAPGFASGNSSHAAGLIGVIGGYRFIFNQGATVGMDVSSNYLSGNDMKKAVTQPGFAFNNQLKRDFNVVPSFSFGKIIDDQLHIALGLGLGIAQAKHRALNGDPRMPASPSQTNLGFVPSSIYRSPVIGWITSLLLVM